MKIQLVILVFFSIAVCLVSGEDDQSGKETRVNSFTRSKDLSRDPIKKSSQRSNVARLNSFIRKTGVHLANALKIKSPRKSNLQFKGSRANFFFDRSGRHFPRTIVIMNKSIRSVLELYGLNFLRSQLRGAKVDIKRRSVHFKRKGGNPGVLPDKCFLVMRYQLRRTCVFGICIYRYFLIRTIVCR